MLAVPGCGASDCPECSHFDVPQVCPRGHHSGIGQDGYFAPYATIDVRGAVLVPKGAYVLLCAASLIQISERKPRVESELTIPGITPAQAAVATDAVMTAYHAVVRRGEVKKDETIFLFGLGGLGFNALQVIHSAIGARVIVSDIRQERLEAAEKLGVPKTDIVPARKSVQDFVTENGLQGKIDTVLDFVGEKQTFEDAQHIGTVKKSNRKLLCDTNAICSVRIAGKVICIGTLSTDNTIHMKMGIRKRLAFIFSYGGQREDLEELLNLMSKGVIMPQTEEGRLEDFPRVLKDLCDGKIKARMALIPSST